METASTVGTVIPQTTEAIQVREMKEREIAALASHAEGPNKDGWSDIFCHQCEANLCTKGSRHELAVKAERERWMIYHSNVLCFDCQER